MNDDSKKKLPFIFRLRGIAVEIIVWIILTTGPPWWLPVLLHIELEMTQAVYCAIVTIVVAILAIGTTLYTRGIQINNREALERETEDNKKALATLASTMRVRCQNIDLTMSSLASSEGLETYLDSLCNDIAQCFRVITGRGLEVTCSVRISDPDQEGMYITKGRSSGFNPSRRTNSTPVTTESKIYQKLTQNGANPDDIVLIKDIEKAIKDNVVTKDKNMMQYPEEIRSMMVARLNVQEKLDTSIKETLWGILYVSSSEEGTFSESDCLYLQVVANLVSTTLWVISDRRKELNEGEDIKENRKPTQQRLS